MSFTASTTMSVATLPIVRAGDQCRNPFKPIVSVPADLHRLGMQSQLINNRRPLRCPVQDKRAAIICAAVLNARCAEGQTQTVTRESSTITVAPVQGGFFFFGFLAFLGFLKDQEEEGPYQDQRRR
ncbi:hypothetical protein HAX54_005978 [Datura stramonium]|uniref:Uncharacterized protein n=1 Tax=Datura stramonium TaxID=4076 RepID=A0ABS8RIG1_DATST|nr:hypothetical protein [Datura stramonium]